MSGQVDDSFRRQKEDEKKFKKDEKDWSWRVVEIERKRKSPFHDYTR